MHKSLIQKIFSSAKCKSDVYKRHVMGSKQALDFWREQGLAEDAAFDVILILRDKKIIVTEGISSFRLNNEDYTYEVAYR